MVMVHEPLSSGRDPFANLTLEGVGLIMARLEGDTGAEHLLDGIGGEDKG
jgi:hypothetical protein